MERKTTALATLDTVPFDRPASPGIHLAREVDDVLQRGPKRGVSTGAVAQIGGVAHERMTTTSRL